jgi:hypothetical protein
MPFELDISRTKLVDSPSHTRSVVKPADLENSYIRHACVSASATVQKADARDDHRGAVLGTHGDRGGVY